mmetsp:Transcript_75057/g.207826  ORF Transcript_75057/g.207826 Transcript_75057/m.207826 type:complete len:341 (-) Transcript_75057:542-1564(-)
MDASAANWSAGSRRCSSVPGLLATAAQVSRRCGAPLSEASGGNHCLTIATALREPVTDVLPIRPQLPVDGAAGVQLLLVHPCPHRVPEHGEQPRPARGARKRLLRRPGAQQPRGVSQHGVALDAAVLHRQPSLVLREHVLEASPQEAEEQPLDLDGHVRGLAQPPREALLPPARGPPHELAPRRHADLLSWDFQKGAGLGGHRGVERVAEEEVEQRHAPRVPVDLVAVAHPPSDGARHVARRAGRRLAEARPLGVVAHLRQAVVDDVPAALVPVASRAVRGLEVAMDDAAPVQLPEAEGELRHRLLHVHEALPDVHAAEVPSAVERHDEGEGHVGARGAA